MKSVVRCRLPLPGVAQVDLAGDLQQNGGYHGTVGIRWYGPPFPGWILSASSGYQQICWSLNYQ